MILSLYTYNGTAINDGTNYTAVIPPGQTMPQATPQYVDRGQAWPYLAGKTLSGAIFTFKIIMRGDIPSQLETLKYLFRTDDYTARTLIAKDTADSDRQWSLSGFPITPPTFDNSDGSAAVIVQLAVNDPLWREVTGTSTNWVITASGQTTTISVRGNYPTLPTISIKPTAFKVGNWPYKRFVTLYNRTDLPFNNYPFSITGAGLDTAALVTAGKMLASGDDLRVMVDGVEVDRWLYGMNTAATLVWVNVNLKARIQLTLGTAIAATGSVSTVTIANTAANKTAIARLPKTGLVMIDSEIFSYSNVNTTALTLTSSVRAMRGTSMAIHATGAAITCIEHDICIQYGNSAATAPSIDDTLKPIFDLDATSTNTTWKYTSFRDEAEARSGIWRKNLTSGSANNQTYIYGGSHTADETNPNTEMGVTIQAFKSGGIWKAGSGNGFWSLYHPAGITNYTVNLSRYRASSSWPFVNIIKSPDGIKNITDYTAATPGGAGAWTALAPGARALGGTYKYLYFQVTGTVAASASNYAACEVNDITLTLSSTLIPLVSVSAEIIDNYSLAATLMNNTTGESLSINAVMGLNEFMGITCSNLLCRNTTTSEWAFSGLSFNSNRTEWLTVKNGDVLTYTETGVTGVTVSLLLNGRNLI